MADARLTLWTGPKHSGKTSAARDLARRARRAGFAVAGILAQAVHDQQRCVGYDLVDLRTGASTSLARRAGRGPQAVGAFTFSEAGLAAGAEALRAAAAADLAIVDEFGPLELAGGGWRQAVDALVSSAGGLILLVVREELVAQVRGLWPGVEPVVVEASASTAPETVLDLLAARRH